MDVAHHSTGLPPRARRSAVLLALCAALVALVAVVPPPSPLTGENGHFATFAGPTLSTHAITTCASRAAVTSASAGTISAGTSILVFVSIGQGGGATVTGVTDTAVDHFTRAGFVTFTGNAREEAWYRSDSAGGALFTVTANLSVTATSCLETIYLTGANLAGIVDVTGSGSTGANTTGGDPQTTALANDLVFMGIAIKTTTALQTVSQVGSWAILDSQMTFSGLGMGVVDLLEAAAGHCYPQITLSTSLSWAALSVSIRVTGAPLAPTGLTIGAITASSIPLAWVNSAGVITNVSIYRWTGAACSGTVTTTSLGSSGTANTQTGLLAGTQYSFEVADWNSTGSSPTSACLSGYTAPSTPVVIPPVLTVVGSTGTSVLASWSAPANVSFGHYALYYGTVYATWALSASGLTALETSISGLTQNTSYFVQVDAYTVLNTNLSQSNIAVAHTLPNLPPVVIPSVLSCAGASTTSVVCDWSAPVNQTPANYSLNHGTAFGTYATHVSQGASTFEAVVTGLAANTTFFFVTIAWSASVILSTSNVAPAHTLVAPEAPEKVVLPSVLTATGISTTSVAVSWGATENVTVANYTLEYGTTYGTYPTHVSEGASTFETVLTGLSQNTTYWFIIYAGTAGDYAAVPSNAVSAHTLAVGVSGPTGVLFPVATAAALNTTTISVSWRAPSGPVTNYTLMYARFYGTPIAYISVGNHTVYNVTNLGFDLTYYFTVWAWNGTALSPASNIAVAQTAPTIPPSTPFPWLTIIQIDTIETVGAFAISCALAVWISGRRGDRHARGGASVALARSRPSPGAPARPPMPGGNRSPPRASQAYTRMASRSRRP